jgi:hypothetical protein
MLNLDLQLLCLIWTYTYASVSPQLQIAAVRAWCPSSGSCSERQARLHHDWQARHAAEPLCGILCIVRMQAVVVTLYICFLCNQNQ